MLKSIQQRDLDRNRWIKITMTVILVVICVSMVVTLVPGLVGGAVGTTNPDTIASVAGQDISFDQVAQQLNQLTQNQNVPEMLKGLYAKQLLDQLVFSERSLCGGESPGCECDPRGGDRADQADTPERLGRWRVAEGYLHKRCPDRYRHVGAAV